LEPGFRPEVAFLDPFESDAVGVGSNDEEPFPPVGCTDGGSREHVPRRIIPARGQLSEKVAHPSKKERWAVFHDDDSGSNFANHAPEFEEQGAVLSVESRPLSGNAEVCAWKPPADDVDGLEVVGANASDVFVSLRIGPVPFEDAPRERVDLHLPERLAARRGLEALFQAPDP
jgi:hypothetical protein